MPPFIGCMPNSGFGAEIIYSFIIIACSLFIYYGTKEIYELSSYKGIKYFRQAFLFFAIAYFFRSFIKFTLMYLDIWNLFKLPPQIFGNITLIFFIYFSSMAIFYLLYSVIGKKIGENLKIYFFHLIAVAISIICIIFKDPITHLWINIFLFVFVIFIVLIASGKTTGRKKKHPLYVIYVLLFFFWILNILDILIPKFLNNFQVMIYLLSSGIFLTILYRVIKKIGSV